MVDTSPVVDTEDEVDVVDDNVDAADAVDATSAGVESQIVKPSPSHFELATVCDPDLGGDSDSGIEDSDVEEEEVFTQLYLNMLPQSF
jgi:hypothetical protein